MIFLQRAYPLNWSRYPYLKRGFHAPQLFCSECGVIGSIWVFPRPVASVIRVMWSSHCRCEQCFAHFYLPAWANAGQAG